MVTILLTQGKVAVVDDEDADLGAFKWYAVQGKHTWYARRVGNAALHRVILERKLGRSLQAGEITDHVNRDGLDNRRANLRLATASDNARNASKPYNRTGYKGVRKQHQRWVAQITVNRKVMHVGTYDTPEEAHTAYCEAAAKYHGEFANFGDSPESQSATHQAAL